MIYTLLNHGLLKDVPDWIVCKEGVADISGTAGGSYSDISLYDGPGDTSEEEQEKRNSPSSGDHFVLVLTETVSVIRTSAAHAVNPFFYSSHKNMIHVCPRLPDFSGQIMNRFQRIITMPINQ